MCSGTSGYGTSIWGRRRMLEVADLRSGYGRIPILDGVSFSLPRGSVFGVLGHNGMGKTTLLKTLIGELPVTGGKIRFNGQDVTLKTRGSPQSSLPPSHAGSQGSWNLVSHAA